MYPNQAKKAVWRFQAVVCHLYYCVAAGAHAAVREAVAMYDKLNSSGDAGYGQISFGAEALGFVVDGSCHILGLEKGEVDGGKTLGLQRFF